MLSKIPPELFELYRPMTSWESFYLRTRWRLCPFELVESFIPKEGNILDFGCGYGLLTNLLALRGASRRVLAIDLNKDRIRVAERTVKERKNVRFCCGDIHALGPSRFQAIVMTDVLHHIDQRRAGILLEKIYGFLDTRGILVILDVDRSPHWKFRTTLLIDHMLNPKRRLWYRSSRDMQDLLRRYSLNIENKIRAHRDLPLSDVLYICKKDAPSEGGDDR